MKSNKFVNFVLSFVGLLLLTAAACTLVVFRMDSSSEALSNHRQQVFSSGINTCSQMISLPTFNTKMPTTAKTGVTIMTQPVTAENKTKVTDSLVKTADLTMSLATTAVTSANLTPAKTESITNMPTTAVTKKPVKTVAKSAEVTSVPQTVKASVSKTVITSVSKTSKASAALVSVNTSISANTSVIMPAEPSLKVSKKTLNTSPDLIKTEAIDITAGVKTKSQVLANAAATAKPTTTPIAKSSMAMTAVSTKITVPTSHIAVTSPVTGEAAAPMGALRQPQMRYAKNMAAGTNVTVTAISPDKLQRLIGGDTQLEIRNFIAEEAFVPYQELKQTEQIVLRDVTNSKFTVGFELHNKSVYPMSGIELALDLDKYEKTNDRLPATVADMPKLSGTAADKFEILLRSKADPSATYAVSSANLADARSILIRQLPRTTFSNSDTLELTLPLAADKTPYVKVRLNGKILSASDISKIIDTQIQKGDLEAQSFAKNFSAFSNKNKLQYVSELTGADEVVVIPQAEVHELGFDVKRYNYGSGPAVLPHQSADTVSFELQPQELMGLPRSGGHDLVLWLISVIVLFSLTCFVKSKEKPVKLFQEMSDLF